MLNTRMALLTAMASPVLTAIGILASPSYVMAAATPSHPSSIEKGPSDPNDANGPECNQRDFRCRDKQHRNGRSAHHFSPPRL